MRARYSFFCRAFNIPLRMHCSGEAAFLPGPAPFIDSGIKNWMNFPLRTRSAAPGILLRRGKVRRRGPARETKALPPEDFTGEPRPGRGNIRRRKIFIAVMLALLYAVIALSDLFNF
jgi:hypothetical protein